MRQQPACTFREQSGTAEDACGPRPAAWQQARILCLFGRSPGPAPAPRMAPVTCAAMLATACSNPRLLESSRESVTAGLIWVGWEGGKGSPWHSAGPWARGFHGASWERLVCELNCQALPGTLRDWQPPLRGDGPQSSPTAHLLAREVRRGIRKHCASAGQASGSRWQPCHSLGTPRLLSFSGGAGWHLPGALRGGHASTAAAHEKSRHARAEATCRPTWHAAAGAEALLPPSGQRASGACRTRPRQPPACSRRSYGCRRGRWRQRCGTPCSVAFAAAPAAAMQAAARCPSSSLTPRPPACPVSGKNMS